MTDTLLAVRNLSVTYPGDDGDVRAVRNVSFTLGRERLGIVGESGSGKSTTGRAIMGLVGQPGRIEADELRLGDTDLRGLSERGFRKLRGQRIAMVLQDPKYSLDPVMSVGQQIAETHRSHLRSTSRDARRAALEMLQAVHIRDPERVYALYPHQVSGGMGQRIMIAMMLIPEPDLLICDEPTSALDVTVQIQVLSIIEDLVARPIANVTPNVTASRIPTSASSRPVVSAGNVTASRIRAEDTGCCRPSARCPGARSSGAGTCRSCRARWP